MSDAAIETFAVGPVGAKGGVAARLSPKVIA
jgi:hypothetical protein